MPLRVALYTPAWPKGTLPNGIVTYTSHLVPALRDTGAEVHVMAASLAPGCSDPGVSVPEPVRDSLPLRVFERLREPVSPGASSERRNAMAIVHEVWRLGREQGLDLIEMEESFGWCGWVASKCGLPVVARLHGPWFLNGAMVEDPRTRSFRRRVRREGKGLARVAAVSAPSQDVLDRTCAHYGRVAPAQMIHNPVPAAPAEEHWDPAKSEPATVLFVGRFDNHKGGDVVIEAFARIRAEQPDAKLVFVGPDRGVTDLQGRTFGFETFLADRLPDASDRAAVEYLGTQSPGVIRGLRRRAAVTVVCSRYEIFGYTLGEAMAQGCPVVATRTGGLPELLEHEESGLLARPDDPDDLARGVLRLIRDPHLAARLGGSAARAHAERLCPAAIAEQTVAFYQRVLRGGAQTMGGHRS